MDTNNVIQFPIQPKNMLNLDNIHEELKHKKEMHLELASDILANMFLDSLVDVGFQMDGNDKMVKDICLCLESIKSLVCKYYDEPHSFHMFAEACFSLDEHSDNIDFNTPAWVSIKEKNNTGNTEDDGT